MLTRRPLLAATGAALVVDGDSYRLVSRAGYPGSVARDGSFSANRTGVPGMWRLRVDATSGELERSLAPAHGAVAALLEPPRFVVDDAQLAVAREQNPDDGRAAAWNTTEGLAHTRRGPYWWN